VSKTRIKAIFLLFLTQVSEDGALERGTLVVWFVREEVPGSRLKTTSLALFGSPLRRWCWWGKAEAR
jgi:hypothetical protein